MFFLPAPTYSWMCGEKCYDGEMLRTIKHLLPAPLLAYLLPRYHFTLALIGALWYRSPSKKLVVVGVTGTKGKSSTAEILDHLLEADGKKTALLGTIKFKIAGESIRNLKKMTMPGRFFVQKFLRAAVNAGCTHAIVEMTSEGAKQFRHRFIDMDALIFTNLAPEHIESHGSYEAYRDAKLSIARALAGSSKKERFMVTNVDDKESGKFLSIPGIIPTPFTISDAVDLEVSSEHASFSFHGRRVTSALGGKFNVYNMLGAGTCAMMLGVPLEKIAEGVAATKTIAGRMEHVEAGQGFPVVVDYAHTPDSLLAIYGAFVGYENICVLGNTGGGRDKWKRKVMGALAEEHCREIILTNEDPYDEDPRTILDEIASGMKKTQPTIILDRRLAIAHAIKRAKEIGARSMGLDEVRGDEMGVSERTYSRRFSGPPTDVNKEIRQTHRSPAVLITGKGTDPFIMGPNGTKQEWDDRRVAEEELKKLRGLDQ